MLIMASIFHVIDPIVTMAAGLSVQSPFINNLKCSYEIMQLRKDLISDHGDPLTLLNAYNEWIQIKSSDHSSSSKWCKKRGLEEQRFYEITKLKKQFNQVLEENYLQKNRRNDSSDEDSEQDDSEGDDEKSGTANYNRKLKKKYEKLYEKREKKRLLELKKELTSRPKKPKILNLNEIEIDNNNFDESEQDYPDIRDIDFKLMHNLNELQNKSLKCKNYTLRQVNLLKIILTCGLSTQLAIADEFNNFKRDSDQFFHSKYKSFVILHPTSIFSYDPDILTPPDDGMVDGKLRFSTRHQLIVYFNLFETNKPYFMNCMRVPALQTLLLYAKSLDTNSDCTRILCDGWIELKLRDPISAQKILSDVICLRASIEKLFKIRIQDHQFLLKKMNQDAIDKNYEDEQEKVKHYEEMSDFFKSSKDRAKKLESILKKKLTEFLDSSILYSIRRLLSADLKNIYVKQFQNSSEPNANSEEINDVNVKEAFSKFIVNENLKSNVTKGGIKINDYLTYNCLISDISNAIINEYSGIMKRHWNCPNCKKGYLFDLKERMEHEVMCNLNYDSVDNTDQKEKASKSSKANVTEYHCDLCNKTFNLTSIEILKHKKSHSIS